MHTHLNQRFGRSRNALAALALATGSLMLLGPAAEAQTSNPLGARTVRTEIGSVDQAVEAIEARLSEAGLNVTAVVEHDKIIESKTDIKLRPTRLIIFENPAVDGEVLRANRAAGIDLPQKILVWKDDDGLVKLSYNTANYIADRHGIDQVSSIWSEMDNVSDSLVRNLTAPAASGVSADDDSAANDPLDPPATEPAPTTAPATAPEPAQLPVTGPSSTAILLGVSLVMLAGGATLVVVSRKRVGTTAVVLAFVVAATAVPASAPDSADAQQEDRGTITVASDHEVADTLQRVRDAAANNKFGVLLTIAQSSGDSADLPPTFLVLLGRPSINGPILEASQTTGLDLPQKMLVWEDEDGTAQITYNDPSYLETRHRLGDAMASLDELEGLLGTIADEAAGA